MKTILTGLILIITITITGSAQDISAPEGYEARENLQELSSLDGSRTIRTFDNRYQGVKGSPYVFDEFRQGEVFLKTKSKVAIQEMNYNCFENELVYKDPATNATMLMNKFQVDFFTIHVGEEVLTFMPVKLEEDAEPIFAEVLYNQGSMVYKVNRKDWIKANYEDVYSANRKYDEFVDKYDLFFLKKGDNVLYQAKKSKKQMIAAFPDHEKEISSFIKSNKLNLKDDESLVSLLRYYDSL